MRQAPVPEVVHVQAVARQERSERLGVFRPPALHPGVAAQDRNVVFGADPIDDRDIALVAGGVGARESELRVDEDERDVRGSRRRDAALDRGPEQRLVHAGDRVVGADLPDHQLRPARLQRAFETLQGARGKFAADAGVLDVEVDARPFFEFRLEPRRIGVRGRTRAYPLGRGGTDRQNVERSAGAPCREGERGAVGVERRRQLAGTGELIGARRCQCE